MTAYFLRRLLLIVPTLIIVSLIMFLVVRIIPGSAVEIMAAEHTADTGLPLDPEDVKRMLGLNERIASVDVPAERDSDRSLLDTIPDEQNPDPATILQNDDVQRHIDIWLAQLNEKQRAVVERRFGLYGRESGTLEEVGNEIGVTRERVRQIQIEVLKRLRQILEREGFSVDALFAEV